MADYVFTQNGDNNVQIGTDRLTGDFKGASMFATVEQARQYNRLRQYEDTGLTPDEIAALRAENERYKADIEAGRLVRVEPCDECRYKLESHAWEYYTYPCRECRQRTKSHFARPEAARAALEKEEADD